MHGHGYSLLEVKSVDAERRVLTGIATTPTPDRVGDIVEPKGVKFKNPLPLLLYHDSRQPVGTVTFKKATDDGIEFEARLPLIKDPGTLYDRVEEAWQSVKEGLLKGVSIGYRILPGGAEFIRESNGLLLKSIEVFELSLVAIPANAECTIQSIKSIDAQHLAAIGEPKASTTTTPGASGSSRTVSTVRSRSAMKKSFSEQIADIKAQIATKQSDLEAIQTKVADEGRTKDAEEREQFNTLNTEVKALEDELADLESLEARAKAAAKPARGTTGTEASATRGAGFQHVSVKANRDPGIGFARAIMCKMAAFLSQGSMNAIDMAKQRYPHDPEIELFLKNNIIGGNTTDSTWAQPLAYASLANEFVEYLRPMTIIGKFGTTVNGVTYPSLQRLPFNVKVNRETAGLTAYWVGEGKPKPVSKGAFDQSPWRTPRWRPSRSSRRSSRASRARRPKPTSATRWRRRSSRASTTT
jgi:HK97 family phage prohead protease